eukprot:11527348-Alexandrium_andersonii.AAC.1
MCRHVHHASKRSQPPGWLKLLNIRGLTPSADPELDGESLQEGEEEEEGEKDICEGDGAVSYTHLRAHETSAHL